MGRRTTFYSSPDQKWSQKAKIREIEVGRTWELLRNKKDYSRPSGDRGQGISKNSNCRGRDTGQNFWVKLYSRTAIRLSPYGRYQEMRMEDPIPQFSHLLTELAKLHPDLAYVHFVDPRVAGFLDSNAVEEDQRSKNVDNLEWARDIWRHTSSAFLNAGGFDPDSAISHFDTPGRENEAVVFGRWFLSNVSCCFIVPLSLTHAWHNSPIFREGFAREYHYNLSSRLLSIPRSRKKAISTIRSLEMRSSTSAA